MSVLLVGLTAVLLWGTAVLPTLAANETAVVSGKVQNNWAMQVMTPTATITPTATLPPTATATATTAPPTNTPPPALTVTGAEPKRIPQETGGILSVYGSGFTPDCIVRLVGYGLLSTTYVNSEALTAQVPPGVPDAKYDVEVNRNGQTAVLKEAVRIKAPELPTNTPVPTNTPTPTATTAWVFGQPQLLIQSSSTDPAILEPGQPFLLTMVLQNLGNYVAIDVTAVLQSTELAVASEGSNVRIVQRIGLDESVTVTMPLVLSETAVDGAQNLNFDLTYFDLNGKSYQTQQSVGLTIGAVTATPTPSAAQPRLVLDTYTVDPPDALKPGGVFELTLNLTNVGNGAAQNIVLTLGGDSGQQLAPFALLNAGNVRYISGLAAGAATPIPQQMIVAGTADSGVFNLPIEFAHPAAVPIPGGFLPAAASWSSRPAAGFASGGGQYRP
ncbi:MAG: IPT/TIG domain-containing protein [Anaerolineae bacterium]